MNDSDSWEIDCPWPTAHRPPLRPDEVHVWCAAIDLPTPLAAESYELLSTDERERAAHYLIDRPRRRFIGCRAAQRMILAQYLAEENDLRPTAASLEFTYSALGKPALADHCNPSGRLRFNVSNSGGIALVAVTLDREIGVDVERIRDNLDHQGLANRYFAPEECQALERLPEHDRLAGFFACWTRKEAFLKAIGKGLTFPLHRAVVSVGPQESCRLVSLDRSTRAAAEWVLQDLYPADGYVGAFARVCQITKIETFQSRP